MKVFLTGATGFVGSRVLEQLLLAGHEITALVRTNTAADKLKARGVVPVLGDLSSLDVIARAAKEVDAVLHMAFIHDFKDYLGACKTDAAVSHAINAALAGEPRKQAFLQLEVLAATVRPGPVVAKCCCSPDLVQHHLECCCLLFSWQL